jgi:anti-anti-sigma regulatory factor
MKFYLIMANGPKQGMPIEIHVDLFLLGADKMCQLRAANLGPKHCALITRGLKVYVRDLDSGKPTLVNGTVVPSGEEWPLHVGDRLAVESLEFMIQFREKPLSQKDLEEWAARCLDVNSSRSHLEDEIDEFHRITNASSAAASIIDKLAVMRGLIKGRLRVGLDNGVTTVRFNDHMLVEEGEIGMIRQELSDQLNKPNLRVLLDCKNVRRMSSQAVTMLREFSKWLGNFGSRMALCRMRSEIRDVLAIFRADKIPYFDDKKKALVEKW